jgi:hypothetical protein
MKWLIVVLLLTGCAFHLVHIENRTYEVQQDELPAQFDESLEAE